jgi:hypothetical protein
MGTERPADRRSCRMSADGMCSTPTNALHGVVVDRNVFLQALLLEMVVRFRARR